MPGARSGFASDQPGAGDGPGARGRCVFFQYRNKTGTRKAIYETSLRLARIALNAGALFILNDHADIAAAVHASGVHLGQDDLPIAHARKLVGKDSIIGISTHSPEQATQAERSGADYIGFGPIFPTSTKDAGTTQGLENVTIISRTVKIPVIAIGGINHLNVADILLAGANGVAVISAVLSAPDLQQAAKSMFRVMNSAQKPAPK